MHALYSIFCFYLIFKFIRSQAVGSADHDRRSIQDVLCFTVHTVGVLMVLL